MLQFWYLRLLALLSFRYQTAMGGRDGGLGRLKGKALFSRLPSAAQMHAGLCLYSHK